MTAINKKNKRYKKELYSLPIEIVEDLVAYARDTQRKKSHIVADAIAEYLQKHDEQKKLEEQKEIEEALSIIGIISANTPDIQEIKANRYQ